MQARLIFIIVIAFSIGGLTAFFLRNYAQTNVMHSGKPLIGGAFSLTDQHGKRVTDKDFRGKYMLVEFGYTYCPDVCPAELQVIAAAMDKLGAKADKVVPIFVTIDPQRDTVEQIASYVSNFSPRIVGLTGTPEEIKEAATAYRVYYAKADNSAGDAYLMDHSTFIYLMDQNGGYLAHFPYGITPDRLAERISAAMAG